MLNPLNKKAAMLREILLGVWFGCCVVGAIMAMWLFVVFVFTF